MKKALKTLLKILGWTGMISSFLPKTMHLTSRIRRITKLNEGTKQVLLEWTENDPELCDILTCDYENNSYSDMIYSYSVKRKFVELY